MKKTRRNSNKHFRKLCGRLGAVSLFLVGTCISPLSAYTVNFFKAAVTYYDFHDNGSCPDFHSSNNGAVEPLNPVLGPSKIRFP